MTSMQFRIEELPDRGCVVILAGHITEEADFQPLLEIDRPGAIRLDLSGIEQINSVGVRGWIHFIKRLTQTRRGVELVRCSPAIVRQLNTLSNFRGGATVRSVMLPYYCASCERQEYRVLDLPPSGRKPTVDEELVCPACGGASEFDDLPATYFGFAA